MAAHFQRVVGGGNLPVHHNSRELSTPFDKKSFLRKNEIKRTVFFHTTAMTAHTTSLEGIFLFSTKGKILHFLSTN